MEKIPVLDKDLLEIEPQTSLKDDFYKFFKLLKIFLVKYCGWITFAISLAFSLWLYFTDSPQLQYDSWTQTFVSKNRLGNELSKSFEIILNGKKYDKLYLSTVILENTGWKAIDGKDVSPLDADPIRITVPEGIKPFLPFKNELTSKSVHLETILRDQEILLKFNYLNPSDKISISFLHEEYPNALLSHGIKVIGNAKNLGAIKERPSYRYQAYLGMGALSTVYLIIWLILTYHQIKKRKKRKEKERKRTDCITRQHTQLLELNKQLEEKSKVINSQNISIASLTNLKYLYLASFGLLKQKLKSNASVDNLMLIIDTFLQKANEDDTK